MNSQKPFEVFSIILLAIASIFLNALQLSLTGWFFLLLGGTLLLFTRREFARNMALIYGAVALLATAPISTDITMSHMIILGLYLFSAAALPYLISHKVYKEHIIQYNFHARNWYKKEILYIVAAVFTSYLVLPFYLKNTGSYLNWTVHLDPNSLMKLFIGTNFFGMWDEFFFIGTVFGVLKRFAPFMLANITQSIIFSGFLYELGFRGWGFIMIFFFAFLQGYVYKKTNLLLYLVSVHLSVDLILYLALIYTHFPRALPIFFQ